jgi:hypothetical protein
MVNEELDEDLDHEAQDPPGEPEPLPQDELGEAPEWMDPDPDPDPTG